LQPDWNAPVGKVPNMEISICFKEMKKGKDKWDESLPHPPVLWFKFQSLSFGRPEKYLLRGLSRNHG
jgi:hypothetical protein